MINSFKACPSKKKGIGVCIKIALILFLAIIIIGFLGINQSSAQTADNDQIIEYEGLIFKKIIVQPGDTLWDLTAKNYNWTSEGLIKQVMRFNKLKNVYIEAGQTIYIPVSK